MIRAWAGAIEARRSAMQRLRSRAGPRAHRAGELRSTLVSILLGVAAWWIASAWLGSPLFPTPLQILESAAGLVRDGTLLADVGVSLRRIAIGFVIGCLVGIPLGLAMALFRTVRYFFEPYVQFFRFVPSIAWLIPAIMWFGIGETSKILIIVYMTVFLVLLNTMAGVAAVRRNFIRSGLCFGVNRWQLFAWIVFPATMSYIVAGARIAMGNSFAAVVGAELIAAQAGLGYLIVDSGTWMAMGDMFAAMLTLGLLGILADRLFVALAGRFLAHYLDDGGRG
jgi:NitT/TauT family transport system permease protein